MTKKICSIIIRGTNVSFSYNNLTALHDMSFQFNRGKHIVILGANGSGKSTLAKHLNSLLIPTEGTVLVNEMKTSDTENIWNIRRIVGMVFQNPENQIVGATVEDDIIFGMENIGLERDVISNRLEKVIQQLQLEDIRYKEPHQLSGGQKQRVAIASVLAMEPDIIVLDEATSMLDPEGRQEVLAALKMLLETTQKTIIQITHDIEEAILADEVYVFYEGNIVKKGKPEEVFTFENDLQKTGLQLPFCMRFYQKLTKAKMVGTKECSLITPDESVSTPLESLKAPMNMKELVEHICELNAKV